jgi:hypothetical protein
MLKGTVYSEFPIQQPGQVLIVVTHKTLTNWSQKMENQKAERVAYQFGIRNFRSFGLAET